MRLVGGVVAGTMADRWGRKPPLMLSILWLSIFAFLSGFSTSYPMLFALRALFGIGMGGVWAAGNAADARALAGAFARNLHPACSRAASRGDSSSRRSRSGSCIRNSTRPSAGG
jgi:MFS family permease